MHRMRQSGSSTICASWAMICAAVMLLYPSMGA
jgi:hypothetical protein